MPSGGTPSLLEIPSEDENMHCLACLWLSKSHEKPGIPWIFYLTKRSNDLLWSPPCAEATSSSSGPSKPSA